MSEVAIQVMNMAKKYEIGAIRSGHDSIREQIVAGLKGIFRRSKKMSQRENAIWALKDVSLEAKDGEVIGIIGRNGAGKSTLLKILSRITEPTSGTAKLHGRVSSLLEVGTGFDGELTGRENIFLSGAILGMRKREIDRKLDDIIEFSGVERFIDTPVKRYSSGMYVRLGFAVAAHLETDILLVDEVLAVGDSQFQKKCLNKMNEVGERGRTILFVSHNLAAISRLCKRIIYLDQGRVEADGPAHEVISTYLFSGIDNSGCREWPQLLEAPGGNIARLRAVRVRANDGQVTDTIDIREPFAIEIEFDVLKAGFVLMPQFALFNGEGYCLFESHDLDADWRGRLRPIGKYISRGFIPGNFLAEGSFFVNCYCLNVNIDVNQFSVPEAVAFHVIDSHEGDSARGDYSGEMWGSIRPMLKWTTQFVQKASGENDAIEKEVPIQ